MGALSDTLLNSALDLAGRGFKVFPLEPGKKTPAVKGWQEKATSDPAIIRRVWAQKDYNIGVKTGGGLIVVDIDVKNGKLGAESWKALGVKAETLRVKTASGGWHVYFAGDGPCSVDLLGPGLDVRGDGGYVVGPGSVLTNGSGLGAYAVDNEAAVAPLPGSIVARLGSGRHRLDDGARTVPAVELDLPDAIARAVDYLATGPLAMEGQGGDLATYKVAAKLKDFGVSKIQALMLMDEHWNDRCEPPWDLEELQEKVENAYAYGVDRPGSLHPATAFGAVRVDDLHPGKPSRWFRHGDPWDRNVRWLYHEALPATGVGVIVGPPQSGKTFVGLELARSLATGKPFFNLSPDTKGGVALLFAGTEGGSLGLRWSALGETDALPISSTTVSDLSARGALGTLLTSLREESARMQAAFGVPLRLVIFETLSASGLLVDENNNSEIGLAFANLGTLSRKLDALVITTHHPPKGGSGERGGSAIRGSADYIMEITREGNESIRRLEITKARDAEQRQLGTFTLLKTDLGKDDRGRPITSMTVSMGEPIVRGGRRSQYADVLVQAVEFAALEAPSEIEGHRAAEWDAALQCFRDLKSGSKDRSNVLAAFRRTVEYAEQIGALGSAVYAGARYLWLKEMPSE